jgi:hypothetical protein
LARAGFFGIIGNSVDLFWLIFSFGLIGKSVALYFLSNWPELAALASLARELPYVVLWLESWNSLLSLARGLPSFDILARKLAFFSINGKRVALFFGKSWTSLASLAKELPYLSNWQELAIFNITSKRVALFSLIGKCWPSLAPLARKLPSFI